MNQAIGSLHCISIHGEIDLCVGTIRQTMMETIDFFGAFLMKAIDQTVVYRQFLFSLLIYEHKKYIKYT